MLRVSGRGFGSGLRRLHDSRIGIGVVVWFRARFDQAEYAWGELKLRSKSPHGGELSIGSLATSFIKLCPTGV